MNVGDKKTAIVCRDNPTGVTFTHICDCKGPTDEWIQDRILADLDLLGHVEVIIKSDGEPALVQLMHEVKKKRRQPTLVRHPPAYDPQINGVAEHAVQDYVSQMKKIKIGLEKNIKMKIESDWQSWNGSVSIVAFS